MRFYLPVSSAPLPKRAASTLLLTRSSVYAIDSRGDPAIHSCYLDKGVQQTRIRPGCILCSKMGG